MSVDPSRCLPVHIKASSINQGPLRYSSPISGFQSLPEDERRGHFKDLSSGSELGGYDEDNDDIFSADSREEQATSLDTLGLRRGPFHHTSSIDQSDRSPSKVTTNTKEAHAWLSQFDMQGTEVVAATSNGNTTAMAKEHDDALSWPALCEMRGEPPRCSSSLAAKTLERPSPEAKNPSSEDSKAPSRLVVQESWDEDFIFQESAESDTATSASVDSARKKFTLDSSEKAPKWDSTDDEAGNGCSDEEEDWDRPSSTGHRTTMPQSSSGRTLRAEQDNNGSQLFIPSKQDPPARDIDFAFPSPAKRRVVSMQPSREAALQGRNQFSAPSTSTHPESRTVHTDLAYKPRVSSDQSHTQERRSTAQILRPIGVGRSALDSAERQYQALDDSPDHAKRRSTGAIAFPDAFRRKIDGHWSQLTSKVGQAKSPAKASESQTRTRTSLQAPSLLQESFGLDGNVLPPSSSESTKSSKKEIDDRKHSHRKGGASLSLSFGLGSSWNRSRASGQAGPEARDGSGPASSNAISRASVVSKGGATLQQMRPPPKNDQSDAGEKAASRAIESGRVSATLRDKRTLASPNTGGTFGRSRGAVKGPIPIGLEISTGEINFEDYDQAVSLSARRTAQPFSSSVISASMSALEPKASATGEECQSSASRSKSIYALQEIKNGMPQDLVVTGRRRTATISSVTRKDGNLGRERPERIIIPDTRHQSYQHENFHGSQIRSATDSQMRVPSDPTHRAADERKAASSSISYSRRNSSGDLKIPSRITKAQEGIRNNINRVRDFASGIEELKALQLQYQERLLNCEMTDRKRIEIMEEYGNWWECAEVLIGLGEGRGTEGEEVDVTYLSKARTTPVSQLEPNGSPARTRSSTRPSAVTNGSEMSQLSMQGTGRESRTTSSRASSSRSVDPVREVDILSAMLTGTSIENVLSSRPSTPHRERTVSTGEGSITGRSPPRNDSDGHRSRQAISQVRTNKRHSAVASAAKADVSPPFVRSRSHQLSSSTNHVVVYPNHDDHSNGKTSDASAYTAWAASTESISTQATTNRRARLRSAGRAGLQGLRELLRSLRFQSAAVFPYVDARPSQSRLSLARTNTNDSRITLDHVGTSKAGEAGAGDKSDQKGSRDEASDLRLTKSMSRSRSLFRSVDRSNESSSSQRRSFGLYQDELNDHENRHSHRPSIDSSKDVRRSLERSTRGRGRTQYVSDVQESSADSNWTNSDFDNVSFHSVETCNPTLGQREISATASSMGRRRHFALSRGPPPSAFAQHALADAQKLRGESQSGNEDMLSTSRRRSLQIPVNGLAFSTEVAGNSSESKSRPASQDLLPPFPNEHSMPPFKRPFRASLRSASGSSSSSFSPSQAAKTQDATVPDSIEHISPFNSAMSSGGYESTNTSSSGAQTEVQDGSGRRSRQHDAVQERKRTSNSQMTPPRVPRTQQAGKFKKMMLQPEAMSSLLLYLDTTKERCQECLELLRLDLPHSLTHPTRREVD